MAVNKNKLLDNATKYIAKGQVDRAIKELQKVIEADPADVRTRLKLGDLFAKKNQNAEAAEQYNIVAESYSKDGFYLKAVAVYKQILKLDSTLIDVHLKLGDLYHQLGLLSDAMSQYQIVAQHYDSKGMAKESLATLRKMVELDPENIQSRKKLAEIIAREGNTAEAIEEFKKIAEDLKAKARLDDLGGVLERIIHLDGGNLEVVKELAALYLDRGDPKRALAKLQVCFRANPHDLPTLEMLSKAFVSLGQPEKAKSVYREIAKIHETAGNQAGKMEAYRQVLSIDPNDYEARAVVEGRAVEPSMGSFDAGPAAEPSLGSISAPAPVPAAAPAPRASMAGGSASVGAAVADDPQTISKQLTEADVYLKYGLLEKALDHLRNIVRRNPGNVEAHLKLKDVYLQHKDIEGAVAEVVAVIEICEQNGDAQRAAEALQEGLGFAPGHPSLEAKQGGGGEAPAGQPPEPGMWNPDAGGDGVEISIEGGQEDVLIEEPEGVEISMDGDAEIQIPDDAGVEIQVDDPSAADAGFDEDVQIEAEPEAEPEILEPPSDESVDLGVVDDISIDPGHVDESLLEEPAPPAAPPPRAAPLPQRSAPSAARPAPPARGAEVVSLDARRNEVSGRMQMPEPSALSPDQLLNELANAFDAGEGEGEGSGEIPPLSIADEPASEGGAELDLDVDVSAPAGNVRSIEERFGATDEHEIPGIGDAEAPEISIDASEDGPGLAAEPGAAQAEAEGGITDFSVDMSGDEISIDAGDEAIPDEGAIALETDDAVAVDESGSRAIAPPIAPATPSPTSSAAAAVAAATADTLDAELPPGVAEDVDEADFFVKQEIYDEAISVYKRLLKKFPGNGALMHRMERAQALLNGDVPAPAAAKPAAKPVAPAAPPVAAKSVVTPAQPPVAAKSVVTAPPKPEPVVTAKPAEQAAIAAKAVEPAKPVAPPPKPSEDDASGHFDLAAELMAELDEIAEEEDNGPSFDETEQVSVADVLREFRKGVDKAVGTEDKQARYDLGIAYREMGLLDEAIGEFEIASNDAGRRADCFNMMGLCQRDKGDLDASIKSFSEAIKTPNVGNKQKAAFWYELAVTLEQQGQAGKALNAYKQVQGLDPGFRDVLEKIKKLGGDVEGGSGSGGSGAPPVANKKIGYV